MLNIAEFAQVYKVFVTINADCSIDIRDYGDFTFKDGCRPECPTCGHKMNKDGFTAYVKIIDYCGTGRDPTINDVTVVIESPGAEREIIPGKDLKEGTLRTELIRKLKDGLYFRLQVLTCSNKNCQGKEHKPGKKPTADRNEHHVLLPGCAVARHCVTTDVLQEALNIWIRIQEYMNAKGLSRISYDLEPLKKLLSSISCGNNSNLLRHVKKIFGAYDLVFLGYFELKWFRRLLDSARIIQDAGPALLTKLKNAGTSWKRELFGDSSKNISENNLTLETVIILNCSHFVRTSSQSPKYSLKNVAATMASVWKGQSP